MQDRTWQPDNGSPVPWDLGIMHVLHHALSISWLDVLCAYPGVWYHVHLIACTQSMIFHVCGIIHTFRNFSTGINYSQSINITYCIINPTHNIQRVNASIWCHVLLCILTILYHAHFASCALDIMYYIIYMLRYHVQTFMAPGTVQLSLTRIFVSCIKECKHSCTAYNKVSECLSVHSDTSKAQMLRTQSCQRWFNIAFW